MNTNRSKELFTEAKRLMPGGVNSPVRAFGAVGWEPRFIRGGRGSRIYDEDGNEFVDYVMSWGPLILGHAHPRVLAALKEVMDRGTTFGAPTALESELARLIIGALPSVEMVRFANSGTEAVMSAVRLSRAFTKRDRLVKFAGCYHGHADGLLVRAGSGVATLGIPAIPGIPAGYAQNTIICAYNHLDEVEETFRQRGEEIAAVIVEPVAGNMGVVLPRPGFLEGLREITRRYGALLIFDEVITGFRLSYSGAQGLYNISPDLTTLGKIIGGGLPVGAYGGRREIMEMVSPSGPVYQAGTFSGNPLTMTAGIETLRVLSTPGTYETLEQKGARLAAGIEEVVRQKGLPSFLSRAGSVFTLFFSESEVVDYATATASDQQRFGRFFQRMLEQGIYLPPSQFEAWFISLAHSNQDIDRTIAVASAAIKAL